MLTAIIPLPQALAGLAHRQMGLKTLSDHFQELGADFGEEIERRASDAKLILETAAKHGVPVEMLWKPAGDLPVVTHQSTYAAARDALFHMNDGHHLKLIALDTVNNPVRAFMHLTQARLVEFMNGGALWRAFRPPVPRGKSGARSAIVHSVLSHGR